MSGLSRHGHNKERSEKDRSNGRNDNGKYSSSNANAQPENMVAGVSSGLMAVFFSMSSKSPFDSSSQNDAADKIKLLIDKNKFVLSQSLSHMKQQNKLENTGNIYNGKLYDEKNLRTVKFNEKKKLQCELEDSKGKDIDNLTPVMTCGANVVENVKGALIIDKEYTKEEEEIPEETAFISQDNLTERRNHSSDTFTNR